MEKRRCPPTDKLIMKLSKWTKVLMHTHNRNIPPRKFYVYEDLEDVLSLREPIYRNGNHGNPTKEQHQLMLDEIEYSEWKQPKLDFIKVIEGEL